MVGYLSVDDVATCLKRFGAESRERKGGVSGINVEPAARALVNDLDGHPHALPVRDAGQRLRRVSW